MNEQQKLLKVGSWVGLALIIFLALISVKQIMSLQYIGRDVPQLNSISVNGKGEAVSIPDIATFSFGVIETAKTVKEATTKSAEKISAALVAVKAMGVLKDDLKTMSYSINPHYEYIQGVCTNYGCPAGKSVLTGYDVSQTIQVKVRDLAKAGDIFDSIAAVGVQEVNGLTFSIDNIESVKAMARADAIADAKSKAEKIAKDLGVRIVRITGFYDSSDEQSYGNVRSDMMAASPMSAKATTVTEIPKGEQKVTASVSIIYEMR